MGGRSIIQRIEKGRQAFWGGKKGGFPKSTNVICLRTNSRPMPEIIHKHLRWVLTRTFCGQKYVRASSWDRKSSFTLTCNHVKVNAFMSQQVFETQCCPQKVPVRTHLKGSVLAHTRNSSREICSLWKPSWPRLAGIL